MIAILGAWAGIAHAEPAKTGLLVPLGLPPMVIPADNPSTHERIDLGRKLFADATLSADGTVGCATCHDPERAFTDGRKVALGIHGKPGTRNTPSLLNAGYNASQFWDGRRPTLESQVLEPFINPGEHALVRLADLSARVRAKRIYRALFASAFGAAAARIGPELIARVLAAYVRSLVTADSPADRFLFRGDRAALTGAAVHGLELFRGRAQCVSCHQIAERDALYTDGRFHSLAVGFEQLAPKLAAVAKQAADAPRDVMDRLIQTDPDVAALGRFNVTLEPGDLGRFKTPSLRNVALTGPYMHDGSIETLEDAVDYEIYYRSQAMGRPLVLTPAERKDLIAFLHGLTSSEWTR